MLDRNLFAHPVEEIALAQVDLTIVNGAHVSPRPVAPGYPWSGTVLCLFRGPFIPSAIYDEGHSASPTAGPGEHRPPAPAPARDGSAAWTFPAARSSGRPGCT